MNGIDDIWAADLIDMQAFSKFNNGVKYLLAVIDIFSKYGWLEPLKTKTGKEVTIAFRKILKDRKPGKIWVDKGKEFYNRDLKGLLDKHNISLYSTENEEKSTVVERWNRTMKEKMFKYFSANSTRKYIDILDELVTQYHNTKHSSTKLTPIQASMKANENKVWRSLYPHAQSKRKNPIFRVGDRVRIAKKKKTFEKGYTPRWKEEIFTITQVKHTDPPTYLIADLNNETIDGSWYEAELQLSKQDIFRIEKVIKKKGNKSLVKWFGYPENFNSWVDNVDLIKLQK